MRLLLAALGTALAGLLAVAGTPASEPKTTCRPSQTRTLLVNKVTRVYQYKRDDHRTEACAFSKGNAYFLDTPVDQYDAFDPPSMSLRGTLLGWAAEFCDLDDGECSTVVNVDDVSDTQTAGAPPAPHRTVSAGAKHHRWVKVGSLRVRPNGAVAWVACPHRDGPPPGQRFEATQAPNCLRPGDRDIVFKLDSTSSRRQVLDRGRGIDPSSLRLKGDRVSWLHGGKLRSAPLD